MPARHWHDYCDRSFAGTGGARRKAAMARPFTMPGDKPHYTRDKQFILHHIRIAVTLDVPGKRVRGTSSLTLSPVLDGLRTVEVDAMELSIAGVRLEGGGPLAFDVLEETVKVRLPGPLRAGQRATIAIDYQAAPRKGLYFIGPDEAYPNKPVQVWSQGQDHDTRNWAPCYDFPNQRATSEVIATVPESMFVLSNGMLVETRADADARTRTYHWRQDKRHATYLITLAAGEYAELRDSANGTPLQYYVPRGREEDGRRTFGRTPAMVGLFTRLTGAAYPWDKYAQITVGDFIFGGMENTSATTLTENTLRDARAALDSTSDPLIAHELAHQWFGDWLTCKDWSHAWLNEGFATYFEALFTEHHLGVDEFRYEMYQNARAYLSEAGQYQRPIVTRVYSEPIDIFDRHLYEKGSLVLHMLRYELGDDLFLKSLQHYVQRHADGVVGTEDLRQAIEEVTGRTMEGFFEQWLYRGGHPDLKVAYSWDDESKSARVTVKQEQDEKESSIFRLPVRIDFQVDGTKTSFRVDLEEKEHRFHFPLPAKPTLMRFDPGNAILKTIDEELPKEMHLERLRKDDDVIGRVRSAQALGKLGSREAVEALKQAVLTDGFWGVQAEAAAALGGMRSVTAREALVACLEIKHPKARRAVVAALGSLKDAAAAAPLARLLSEGDESYFVEAEAARALGKSRSSGAFDALVRALDRDSYQDVVRSGAMDGLAELRDERGLEIARQWARYGKPQAVRPAAVGAAAKLGEERRDAAEWLSDYLHDPWLRVRLRAVGALEELAEWKGTVPLQDVADHDLDARVRRTAKEAIAAIRDEVKPKAESAKLREDLDKVRDENRDLKERLDKLEARLGGPPGAGSTGGTPA